MEITLFVTYIHIMPFDLVADTSQYLVHTWIEKLLYQGTAKVV